MALVDRLGPENVYVSVYESGSRDDTKNALSELDVLLGEMSVQRTIRLDPVTRAEDVSRSLDQDGWVHLPNGTMYLRRIPFLSRVRNRVLEPLDALASQGEHFDTILFLNDVVFSPEDVLTLLATNNGSYAAACSLDFMHYPRYYDTFALRDSSGHGTVSQTWPYFRSALSRHATQHFRPVPVASCWNGMVAMPAAPFMTPSSPLRFRAIPDTLAQKHVEGSECCLIHADNPLSVQKGVWVNPVVRVGYNGTSYDAIQAHSVMGVGKIWRRVWKNRILRWWTTPAFKEWVVRRRVREWVREQRRGSDGGEEEEKTEKAAFCLVNEMQVIGTLGWKHL